MDDLEDIFSNLKLNSDNRSDTEDAAKYFKEIDIAFNTNETTSKWINELQKEFGNVVDGELNKLLQTAISKNSFEEDAGALKYSVVEIIAKRCIRIEMKIRRDEFQPSDVVELVKFINQHKAYYAEKENMVGFRYVADCLAIKGQLKEIQKESTKVSASGLKDLLKKLNEYQHFGIPNQVGVLAIKQYYAGNLLKDLSHCFQLRIIRDVSI